MRIAVVLVLLAACGKNTEPPPPSSGSPMAQPESGPTAKRPRSGSQTASADVPEAAKALFANVCATCHGADGSGNGPAAAALNPKPRNYTDPAWQASITDDQIKQTIVLGGQAVGKSAMMPAQAQLKDQPDVLDGLVKIIRGFGKK
jgi:mono/diheme cytochrome c family protein